MYARIIKILAVGLGAGYLPLAPGTFGSLLGIPLYLVFVTLSLPLLSVVVFTCLAIYIAHFAEREFGKHDPGEIVIDEVAGMLWALLFVPLTLINTIVVFLLFRFFDILKVFPANYLEKKLTGGLAIVLDDVAAGVSAGAVLWLAAYLVNLYRYPA